MLEMKWVNTCTATSFSGETQDYADFNFGPFGCFTVCLMNTTEIPTDPASELILDT